MMNNVLIADDRAVVRLGVELLVKEVLGGRCLVDFAKGGREVILKLMKDEYRMLVTDLDMAGSEGLEMITRALSIRPELRILVLSDSPQNIFAHRVLKAGVYGYIQKRDDEGELKRAIEEVSEGRRYISKNQALQFFDAFLNGVGANPFDTLSSREFEVALMLLKGRTVLEIARLLSINISTASTYRGRIYSKLGVKNLIELIGLARHYSVTDEQDILSRGVAGQAQG